MKNKSDIIFYVLSLVGFLVPFVLLLAFKYSSGVASTAGGLVLWAIYSYAAFWGFSMTRGLAAPLHRRQAFWVGAAGAYFAVQWLLQALFNPFYPYGGTVQTRFLLDSYNNLGYTMIFAWINATMPLVYQSDPLLRDVLKWKRLRLVLWPLVLVGAFVTIGLEAIQVVTGDQFPLLFDVFSSVPYPVILLGAIGLGLGIKRSSDLTFRRQLRWFGLSATLIVGVFLLGHLARTLRLVPASEALLVQAVQYASVLLAGVFLFRSAKDLVPLSPVPVEAIVDPRKRIGRSRN